MTSPIPGIERRAAIGIAVLIVTLGSNASATLAQLGATKATLSAEGQLTTELSRDEASSLTPLSRDLRLEPALFVSGSAGLKYRLGFRDGKVAYVQIETAANNRVIPDAVLVQGIAALKHFDDQQLPVEPKWRGDDYLSSLFPPCGRVTTEMAEVFRPTNKQSRVVTFSDKGHFIKATPWQTIWESTGTFKQETTSSFHYRITQKSQEDGAVLVMSVGGYYSPLPSQRIKYAAVMSPEAFWQYAIGSVSQSLYISGYEREYEDFLNDVVPESVRDKVKMRRLALSIIGCTELSSLPLDEVIRHYRDQMRIHPKLESQVDELLLNSNFLKVGAIARERHYQLAGEIGGIGLIGEFTQKMPTDAVAKRQAVAALSRIADRHQVTGPPLAAAEISEFRAWAARVKNNARAKK